MKGAIDEDRGTPKIVGDRQPSGIFRRRAMTSAVQIPDFIRRQLQDAIKLYQAGRLDQAARLCEAVIGNGWRGFDVVHLLSILSYQQGNYERAYGLLTEALQKSPQSLPALSNMGLVLQALHRPHDALESYDRAILLDPGHASVHLNRGNVLVELNRLDEALASFDTSIGLDPGSVLAHNNRGNVLKLLCRLPQALESFDRAITLKPDLAEAHIGRAGALAEMGCPDEALAVLDRLIGLRPQLAEAHYARGNVLRVCDRLDEAFGCYNRALALKPNLAEAHCCRGSLLAVARRFEEALSSLDQALALKPELLEAHHQRAFVLYALKRPEQALDVYERIAALNPSDIHAFGAIANSALHCCDWNRTRQIANQLDRNVAEGKYVIEPLTVLGYSDDPSIQAQSSRNFVRHRVAAGSASFQQIARYKHDRIRLAYISADFRSHPVGFQVAELLETHDRTRFSITGVSLGADDATEMRRRIVGAFDDFIDARDLSDREVAKLLREREIDIAVDLMGHTTSNRIAIFSHRPAPIRVHYLGYPNTTGAPFIDYLIADPVVIPFEARRWYEEKIVYLPDCYLVNDRSRVIAPDGQSRALAGLPERGFVFCCFNSNYKITSDVFDVWMRLLAQIEGSLLWLARDSDVSQRNLLAAAEASGIAGSRLVFAERVGSSAQHLGRHHLADLFLDTIPFNAHSTGSSALWAGLPFITCMGNSFQSRVGASLLHAIGLPELITRSLEEYEALAKRLACDRALLMEIRQRLERNRLNFPLFDTDRFRRHLEAAYTHMWELEQAGNPPQSFSVPPEPVASAARADRVP